MNEPHPLAKLLARVGATGRENLIPDVIGAERRPYQVAHEGDVWFRFLHEALAQVRREHLRIMEGKFQRLAEELRTLATSLEALGEAIRQGPPPDDRTNLDEPDAPPAA